MLESLGSLRPAVKFKRLCTESIPFFLNYYVTALALLFCCVVISADRFVGVKIKCLSKPSDEINADVLNNYCWAASTYSVKSSYLKEVGVNIPHPGIEVSELESQYEYRNFYQYVHIVLFIQAVMFYIPHLLWKSCEPDFISIIYEEMNNLVLDPRHKSLDAISTFIENRWGSHKILALKYFMCEVLAIVNIIIQAYLLDVFLHGKFLSLGLWLETYYNSQILSDPIRLFPLITICNFRRYGPSGYIDLIDALCVLPINTLNAKIYLCLWIWFTLLLFFSFTNLIYLMICMISPGFRVLLSKILSSIKGHVEDGHWVKLATVSDFGDWFVLSSLKNYVDNYSFSCLSESILAKLPSLVEDNVED